MKLFIAELFSYAFHPVIFFLLMPFFVIYRQTQSELYALKWVVFSGAFIVAGVVVFIYGRMRGIFSDFDISKKEERLKFYEASLLLGFLYLGIALFLKGIFFPISIIALGISIGIIFFVIVNQFLKASVHLGVASAFVVTLSILYGKFAFMLAIPILPMLAWARLVLRKHTFFEVVAGGLLGVVITFVTFMIGKYLYN